MNKSIYFRWVARINGSCCMLIDINGVIKRCVVVLIAGLAVLRVIAGLICQFLAPKIRVKYAFPYKIKSMALAEFVIIRTDPV